MAQVSSGSFTTNASRGRSLTFNWSVDGTNVEENYKLIYWTLVGSGDADGFVMAGNFKAIVDGEIVYEKGSDYRIELYKDTIVANGFKKIYYDANGTKSFSASVEAGIYEYTKNVSGSGSWELPNIPRYTTITSFTVSNITGEDGLTQVQYKWSTSDSCDYAWYSIDGGTNYYALPLNEKITGLTPGTSYKFRLKVRRTDSQLETQSSIVTKSTYDIAKISELNNFEHCTNPIIKITNPAGISSLNLVMKIGNTQILSRTVSTGSNTITFSDTELNNLYKTYGSKSSVTATFILSGGGYTNSKTCVVNLKGNQKTFRTNVSNSWKRAKVWTNVSGTWKRGVIWTNVNGTWKRGI